MTKKDFQKNWEKYFPGILPLGQNFKTDFALEWVRFYSLANGKRYPENEQNWLSIIEFQNALLTEILGKNSISTIVAGEYIANGHTLENINLKNILKQNSFQKADSIDLHSSYPNYYDFGTTFLPYFTQRIWSPKSLDNMLRDVADDKYHIFFVSENWDSLTYLYDGGIDCIIKDTQKMKAIKEKFHKHISKRDDGL